MVMVMVMAMIKIRNILIVIVIKIINKIIIGHVVWIVLKIVKDVHIKYKMVIKWIYLHLIINEIYLCIK